MKYKYSATTILLFSINLISRIFSTEICGEFSDCESCAGSRSSYVTCSWCEAESKCVVGIMSCSSDIIQTAYNCMNNEDISMGKEYLFNDSLITTKILPLIGAANGVKSDEKQPFTRQCLSKISNDIEVVYTNEVSCSGWDNCAVFVAINPRENELYIGFRNSVDILQTTRQYVDFLLNRLVKFKYGGRVLAYYSTAVFDIWTSGMDKVVKEQLEGRQNWKVYLVGHGLGGSLASLCVLMIAKNHSNPIHLYTFGQPRTGNIDFAMAVQETASFTARITRYGDMLADMPKRLGYSIELPHHFGPEIFYTDDTSFVRRYKICDQPDGDSCNKGVSWKFPWTNSVYFGKDMGDWHEKGCSS